MPGSMLRAGVHPGRRRTRPPPRDPFGMTSVVATRWRAPQRSWLERAASPDPQQVRRLAGELRLPEPVCELLVRRGYADPGAAAGFLKPRLASLHDPFLLQDMDSAVERISSAIRNHETILVHGDYDVDGVCAVALLTRVLRSVGARAEAFVPHRVQHGYDLGEAGIREAAAIGARLIITVDCGISALDTVAAASRAGIDVIVTDHHTPGARLPDAVAVLNPKRADNAYPNGDLAGTGVAFKLAQALGEAFSLDPDTVHYHLDLVALATVADVVPLTGENRILTRYGLRVLEQTQKAGLRALMRVAALGDGRPLTAGHVSHVLAPRINAIGRLDAAAWGVKLLLTDSPGEADALAARLEASNGERRRLDRQTLDSAIRQLEEGFDPERDAAVVLAGEGWHPGVIGIVASRVVELVHRPTVLIAVEGGDRPARGSARSIPGYHLYDALRACADHLIRFGGHRHAAGFDIRPEGIEAFAEALRAHASAELTPDHMVPQLKFDMELPLHLATPEIHRYLRHLGPFGAGNPEPVFVARDVRAGSGIRVVGDGHVKLTLERDGLRVPAIGFRMAERYPVSALSGARMDVAYQLQENQWRGQTALQARLVDVRVHPARE